ncbi:MAG: acyl-CoA dehydrogenase [Desulfobacterales bacterium]|nr:acyl-CoA dehydrogenase [Desulfobacterales bacterium]
MAQKFISMRNLKFLLYEVFDVEALTRYPYFATHNKKMFDLVLDAANKLGTKLLYPVFEEMDRYPPRLEDGQVKVHPQVAKILKEFGKGGWISARFAEEFDGDQLPLLAASACWLIFCGANYSAAAFPALSAGAARLITSFGDQRLIDTYVSKMLSGRWQGTMALTEPQAGSSLTDITTTAVPSRDGTYRMKGRKVFISAGDHDGAENIIHLMLAKIEGAPAGIKGVSLFVVPSKRIAGDGKLLPNDIVVSQIFHKLGYRGCPITELSIGENENCHGYLVGDPHRGIVHMFQMMNEERVGVGTAAAAIASAAYYAALEYTRQRPQGRRLMEKNPAVPQIPIIEHADVKRMLLFQRSVVEGSFALLLQCARYEDLVTAVSDEAEKDKYRLLLDLLTPVAKSYPSEMGILATSQAIQCFGGYGYCEDFPVEQLFRDIRIHAIHEGTTGIQAMDLLGRKLVMHEGRAGLLFVAELEKTIAAAETLPDLEALAGKLDAARQQLQEITFHLLGVAGEKGPEVFLADASLFLELFGIVAIAWQWLQQAVTARKALTGKSSAADINFYKGKIFTCRYFFSYELPKMTGLAARLVEDNPVTMEMETAFFSD